jgi:hypothetical protein
MSAMFSGAIAVRLLRAERPPPAALVFLYGPTRIPEN